MAIIGQSANPFMEPLPERSNYVMDAIDLTGYVTDEPKKKSTVRKITSGAAKKRTRVEPSKVSAYTMDNARADESNDLQKDANTIAISQNKIDNERFEKRQQGARLKAGLKFGLDMLNAKSAYDAVSSAAALNIMETRRQANDALARGKQAALEERVAGELQGEQTLLSMIAQGQGAQSDQTTQAVGSDEDIGIYNGLQAEINSITEAMGFELEEIAINYQVDQAKIERNASYLSSAANYGTSIYTSTL